MTEASQAAIDALNARRAARRLEVENRNRAAFRRSIELAQAEREASTRPAQAKPRPKPPVREKTGPSIRPCVGGCGRLTRTSGYPKHMAPESVVRRKGGMCDSCLDPTPKAPRRADLLPWDDLIAAYQAGAALRVLSAEHRVAKTTIAAGFRARGVQVRRQGGDRRNRGAA